MPRWYARAALEASFASSGLVRSTAVLPPPHAASARTIALIDLFIAFPFDAERPRGGARPVSLRDQRAQQLALLGGVLRLAALQPLLQRGGGQLVVARVASRLLHR